MTGHEHAIDQRRVPGELHETLSYPVSRSIAHLIARCLDVAGIGMRADHHADPAAARARLDDELARTVERALELLGPAEVDVGTERSSGSSPR